MPKLDKKVAIAEVISYETEMVLRLLLDEVNRLRNRAQLPPITDEQVRQAVKQYLQTHPREGRV